MMEENTRLENKFTIGFEKGF